MTTALASPAPAVRNVASELAARPLSIAVMPQVGGVSLVGLARTGTSMKHLHHTARAVAAATVIAATAAPALPR